jgi:pimeloyl-ACP methyl ester carboxylesterase
MTTLSSETIEIGGLPTRVLRAGRGTPAALFLHGGVPGVTPWCSGAHIWRDVLLGFAAERSAIALDMPGSGETGRRGSGALTIETWKQHILAALRDLKLGSCHLVGHAEGGVAALLVALEAPELISSVCLVASGAAAPTGDRANDLTFAAPPHPKWSRLSQKWALEQISYAHHHIDDALLSECEAAAAAQAAHGGGAEREFGSSIPKAKSRLWVASREGGVKVPVQMIWAMNDPLTSVEQGMTLYQVIASRQRIADFHLVNRAGSLLFREEPAAFLNLVGAFHESLQ